MVFRYGLFGGFLISLYVLTSGVGVTAQDAALNPYPPLTGAYAVGRTSYHWLDNDRAETYTDDPDDVRELMAYVWYPAVVEAEMPPLQLFDAFASAALAERLNIDPTLLTQIHTHAYAQPPLDVSAAPYPVLVLSHASGGMPEFYSGLAEQLASHGYIVVGVSHPYNALVTAFPDGRVSNTLPDEDPAKVATMLGLTPMEQFIVGERLSLATLEVWTADLIFTLDQLERMNTDDSLLAGAFDLEHIGALAHSLGGAALIETARMDNRLDAVVNIDGSLWGTGYEAGLEQPVMYITAVRPEFAASMPMLTTIGYSVEQIERLEAHHNAPFTLFEHSSQAYFVSLDGAVHFSFDDFPLLLPMMMTEEVMLTELSFGAIEPERILEIVNTYLLAFFDQHLREIPSDVFTDVPYGEVSVEVNTR